MKDEIKQNNSEFLKITFRCASKSDRYCFESIQYLDSRDVYIENNYMKMTIPNKIYILLTVSVFVD